MQPDDTLALVLPNGVEMLAAYLAGTQIGCYVTPINHHLVGPEIAYIVSDSEAKALIGHERFAGELAKVVEELGDARRRPRVRRSATVAGFRSFAELIDGQPDTPPAEPHRRRADALHVGHHRQAQGREAGPGRHGPRRPRSRSTRCSSGCSACSPHDGNVHITGSPLYHTAVLLWTATRCTSGHKVVLMDKWDAEEMLRLIDEHKVTTSHMVPTQLHRLLALPEEVRAKYDCSSTRCMVHAAAPCPPEVKRRMIEWWGDAIMEYYAATEGGGTIVTAKEWLERPGTVGKAWPGAEVRIYDDEGNAARPRRDRHRLHGARPGRLRVQGRREEDQGQPHHDDETASSSSPSATSASSTRTATCSSATARST